MEVRDPRSKETYWGQGVYREVKPPERIVFSWSWTKDVPDGPQLHPGSPETEVTVEFFARGNSTEVVVTHAVFGSAKDRDDHRQGWNGCLDLLPKRCTARQLNVRAKARSSQAPENEGLADCEKHL